MCPAGGEVFLGFASACLGGNLHRPIFGSGGGDANAHQVVNDWVKKGIQRSIGAVVVTTCQPE